MAFFLNPIPAALILTIIVLTISVVTNRPEPVQALKVFWVWGIGLPSGMIWICNTLAKTGYAYTWPNLIAFSGALIIAFITVNASVQTAIQGQ
jgi:hypothetical protein